MHGERKCEVAGCGEEHRAKGLCLKHYMRFQRGVDPHAPTWRDVTLEERLKAKLAPQDPVTGCIEWIGCRNNDGYGQISRAGKMIGTHCLAYELKHGPIPEGLCVCHTCDNRACCNDDHHFLDTKAGNNADMTTKGRRAKGESNGNAKLTAANVTEIRRRIAAGELQSEIASDFGISRNHVSRINKGKTRKI
jgi:predicted XRE-type DNA-binding protein